MSKLFGKRMKELRLQKGMTLREFCQKNGFDPGNYSRLERGLFAPPQKELLLERYATALGLRRGSDEWIEFFDLAATARGEIPHDLLSDDEVVKKFPVLFRTIRGTPIPPEKLDELVKKIRRT